MDRRQFLKSSFTGVGMIGLAGLTGCKLAGSGLARSGGQPNIILILVDDLGWGDLSCQPQSADLTDARTRTPNIDRLATEGVRCTQAYATGCVCAPSRAGLLTGRYQQQFGWYEFKEELVGIPPQVPLLPEVLKSAGYATACIGKWHVGHPEGARPMDRGFDRFFGFLGGQHDYYDPRLGSPLCAMSFDFDAYVYDQGVPVSRMEYMTDEFTRHSLDFIKDQAARKKPFFLYLAYNTPHPPMQATRDKLQPYAEARGDQTCTPRDLARAMIDTLDEDVGRLMTVLRELGIDDNTLVIFTSDNGGADDTWAGRSMTARTAERALVQYNGGLRPRKGFFWEGGIRVPMIVCWPGQLKAGRVYTRPVSHLDIFATCGRAAGCIPAGCSLDGIDLVPYFRGDDAADPHEVLHWGLQPEYGRWAVRKGKWKLIRERTGPWAEESFVTQLHDLEADLLEQHDVSREHPGIVQDLQRLKDDFERRMRPSLATPAVIANWEKELNERKAKRPRSDHLRRDGAPGVGDWPAGEYFHKGGPVGISVQR